MIFYFVAAFVVFCFFLICMHIGMIIANKKIEMSCSHDKSGSVDSDCACKIN